MDSNMLQDPRQLTYFFKNNKKQIYIWSSFLTALYILFSYHSSQEFSFVLTLGSLVQLFGTILVTLRVHGTGSVTGLSKNSIICYMICGFFRNISLTFYEGYVPLDRTGDFIYTWSEKITMGCFIYIFYLMHFKLKKSYNWDLDTMKFYFLLIPTFILAVIVHPSLNGSFGGDFPWTFALYLESVAMLPQLDVFRKKGGEIETFTSHFVASSGISRALHFFFWIFSYSELNEIDENYRPLGNRYAGVFVLGFQIIQILLLVEYLYYYIKSLKSNAPFTLPIYLR